MPDIVVTAVNALRNRWRQMNARRETPLPSAVRAKLRFADLEHGGARGAKNGGADAEAEDEGGKDDLLKVQPRISEEADEGQRRREVVKLRGHEDHQHRTENETSEWRDRRRRFLVQCRLASVRGAARSTCQSPPR